MKPSLFSNPLRLGFGCSSPWGMRWFSERRAARLVRQALDLGVRHFDTGSFYCSGEAEYRLGRALEGVPVDDVFVSTKIGTRLDRNGVTYKDFSETAVREDVETSLRRLRRERLDLLYLHGPGRRQINSTRELLERLKEEGKIAAIGVCGEGSILEYVVDQGSADVIMGVYNFFRREHAAVFSRASQSGIGVAAIAPLAQGVYRKGFFLPRSLSDVWALSRAIFQRRDDLLLGRSKESRLLQGIDGWKPAQAALGFVLANQDIDVAITTTTKVRHLVESAAAARRPLPEEALERFAGIAPLDRQPDGE